MSDLAPRYDALVQYLSADGLINEVYVSEQAEAMARNGHSDATLLMSVICAIGYGRDRDWTQALDWLGRAAEQGVPAAQAQLRMLSGGNGDDWRQQATSVDIAAQIAARPTRLVIERPHIGMADGFLNSNECAWLISRAKPMQKRALVYDPKTGLAAEDDVRSNTIATFTILTLDLPLLLMRERIAATMVVPIENFERTSVFRYEPGQEFASHADYLNPSPQLNAEIEKWGQRPLTFLVYLNDPFDAGETHFLDIDRKLRGRTGEALFFRNVLDDGTPDFETTHAGVAPENGEKWLFSQFVRSKPQMPG